MLFDAMEFGISKKGARPMSLALCRLVETIPSSMIYLFTHYRDANVDYSISTGTDYVFAQSGHVSGFPAQRFYGMTEFRAVRLTEMRVRHIRVALAWLLTLSPFEIGRR